MKPLPLLVWLALTLPASAQTPPVDAAKFMDEIGTWRTRLPHVDPPNPTTAEFEPRLDKIADSVKAARKAEELVQPRKDFEAWQHDLTLKSYQQARRLGLADGSLNEFSARQRSMLGAFSRQRDQVVAANLQKAGAAAGDGGSLFYDGNQRNGTAVALPGRYGPASPEAGTNAPPQGAHLRVNDTPVPPPSAKPFSLASLRDYFDQSGISDAVVTGLQTMKNRVAGFGHLLSGFAGSCYYGAKWLLIKAGALPPEVSAPEEIGEIGIGSGRAYMMNSALKRSPKLQAKLRVRRLDLKALKDSDAPLIPERTTFVFDRGCAGMSAESGHIEISMRREKLALLPAAAFYRARSRGPKHKPAMGPNDVLACSDGCAIRSPAYLRTYGRKGCLNAYVPVNDTAAPRSSEPPAAVGI